MPTRPIAAAAALVVVLAACSGAPTGTGPAPATPAGSAAAPTGNAGSTAAAVDLSQLDVCALVGEGMAATLTGETDFTTDSKSDPSSASCFWAVAKPGVPQYLEVRVFRRTAGLADYLPGVSGATCTGTVMSGVGAEAKGGVCAGVQQKVFLIAMDRGVAVQVLVNEPKGALTPAQLADAVNAVLAGLG